MMDNKTKQLQTIVFIGALWGICEATIGHIMHFLPSGFSGMIMFPIGFYFMYYAFKQTGEEKAILMTGFIAGAIKLTGFLLPINSPMAVLNPAISIVLESLVVFGFIKIFNPKGKIIETTILGFCWVITFTLVQGLIFKPIDGLYLKPVPEMLLFIVMNAAVSGILLSVFLKKQDFSPWKPSLSKQTYAVPFITLQVAVVLEIINSLVF